MVHLFLYLHGTITCKCAYNFEFAMPKGIRDWFYVHAYWSIVQHITWQPSTWKHCLYNQARHLRLPTMSITQYIILHCCIYVIKYWINYRLPQFQVSSTCINFKIMHTTFYNATNSECITLIYCKFGFSSLNALE